MSERWQAAFEVGGGFAGDADELAPRGFTFEDLDVGPRHLKDFGEKFDRSFVGAAVDGRGGKGEFECGVFTFAQDA